MQRLTSHCAKRAARPTSSQGFALLEALVALLVVALGLLGILGLQMRTLADTQNGVRQAQAIRLIETTLVADIEKLVKKLAAQNGVR